MHNDRVLKQIYTFFLGILIALFVGVGISTFYPSPKAPIFPYETSYISKEPTAAEEQIQREFDIKMNEHNEKMKPYNRNVSIMTLGAAVFLLVVGLVSEKKFKIISDGVTLGGLFTLLYSIGRGFASENNKYIFTIISIGLAVVIYIGFNKFVKHEASQKQSA